MSISVDQKKAHVAKDATREFFLSFFVLLFKYIVETNVQSNLMLWSIIFSLL